MWRPRPPSHDGPHCSSSHSGLCLGRAGFLPLLQAPQPSGEAQEMSEQNLEGLQKQRQGYEKQASRVESRAGAKALGQGWVWCAGGAGWGPGVCYRLREGERGKRGGQDMHGLGEDLGFYPREVGPWRAVAEEGQSLLELSGREHRKRQEIRPAIRMWRRGWEGGGGKWVDFQSIWRQSRQNLPPS